MRIALIADIHGNSIALDAVLAALAHGAVDQVVCLGDVAVFGPDPCGVIARLRTLECHWVMGNTDDWALDPQPRAFRNEDTPYYNAIELWGAAQLSAADRAFLQDFRPTVTVPLEGATQLLCYHGSPRSYYEDIRADTPEGRLQEMFAEAPVPITDIAVAAGGHTHIPMLRRFDSLLLVNPGSVGQPVEYPPGQAGRRDVVRHPPWAEYAVIEAVGGRLTVELCRTSVDAAAVAAQARDAGMPHLEWWSQAWR